MEKWHYLLKIFKGKLGISLVEIMLGAGIAGGLAIATATLITNSTKTNKLMIKRFEEVDIIHDMMRLMSDERFCTNTMKNKIVPDNLKTSLTLPNGITDGTKQYYKIDGKKLGDAKIEVDSYFLDTTDVNTGVNTASNSAIGTADFVIRFDRGSLAGVDRNYERSIRLAIELEDTSTNPLANRVIKKCRLGAGYNLGYWNRDNTTKNIDYDKNNSSTVDAKVLIGVSAVPAVANTASMGLVIDDSKHMIDPAWWVGNGMTVSNNAALGTTTVGTFQAIQSLKIPIRADNCAGCPVRSIWIVP